MGPWAQAVFDTLEGLASPAVLEEVLSRGMLEVLPLTHIRGRSLSMTRSSSSTRHSRWSAMCC
ncbi:PhoH family protein [Mycobacterium tuberculosis CAS/NITR204]|uniref:PhoH family protein n=1 Tax=Mycobacterium tuberculosis CAS/NITR204 TaxID=1310114 RepID=R4MBX0_MYCTX|nr:PhoH family protein [Mycobacterium tuberculosis CAS/NITR204]